MSFRSDNLYYIVWFPSDLDLSALTTIFLSFFLQYLSTFNRITESDRVTATARSHICSSEKAGSGNALEMAVQVRLPVICDNAFLIKGL